MSLKAFHIFFVVVCTVLALFFAGWALRQYLARRELGMLISGVGGFLGAVSLVVYGRWFLRKLKGVGYL